MPQEVGTIYKELDVTTKDSYRIETWFYPAQDVPAEDVGQSEMLPYKTMDDSRRPTLIICNGNAGSCGAEVQKGYSAGCRQRGQQDTAVDVTEDLQCSACRNQ